MTAWIRQQTEFYLEVLIMIKDAEHSWTFGALECSWMVLNGLEWSWMVLTWSTKVMRSPCLRVQRKVQLCSICQDRLAMCLSELIIKGNDAHFTVFQLFNLVCHPVCHESRPGAIVNILSRVCELFQTVSLSKLARDRDRRIPSNWTNSWGFLLHSRAHQTMDWTVTQLDLALQNEILFENKACWCNVHLQAPLERNTFAASRLTACHWHTKQLTRNLHGSTCVTWLTAWNSLSRL